ncbi:TlpA family protein disulfide reductase [Niabella ginsenosidivorans]|uniref:TlpA family protein disulfide reductase n=1 Tax=Niabella ginsenosidivorans TaxID=1176587 RepID=UPI00147136DB|nr:thioredoxin domain-containing protein [Niabella ginsenosidivorans]
MDGTGFTYQQIEKNRPLLLIYFSPTCDHCKEFVAALLQNRNRWKDKQVVLISYEHIREVKAFADSYHLSAYPNIKIGSEGYTFVVQQYYQIQRFPFVALFSRQGKLIKIISDKLAPEAMVHQI